MRQCHPMLSMAVTEYTGALARQQYGHLTTTILLICGPFGNRGHRLNTHGEFAMPKCNINLYCPQIMHQEWSSTMIIKRPLVQYTVWGVSQIFMPKGMCLEVRSFWSIESTGILLCLVGRCLPIGYSCIADCNHLFIYLSYMQPWAIFLILVLLCVVDLGSISMCDQISSFYVFFFFCIQKEIHLSSFCTWTFI